jgi:antitoxin HicB
MSQTYKPEVESLLQQPWTIEIRPYPEGGFFARVVELRGCMTEADSPEEVLTKVREAQAEWLASAVEHGDPIPTPRGASEYSGKVFLRTSPGLHRAIVEEAARQGVSMSQWAAEVLAREVGLRQGPGWPREGDGVSMVTVTTPGPEESDVVDPT